MERGGFKRGEMELFQLIRLKLTRGSRLREMIETWFVHRPTPFPSFSLPYLFCDHCRSCSRDFSSSRLGFHLWRDDFSGENIARNLSRWSRIHSRIVSRYDVPSPRWLLAELNERERERLEIVVWIVRIVDQGFEFRPRPIVLVFPRFDCVAIAL